MIRDAFFPSTNIEKFQCALLLDLVSAKPGLDEDAYVDMLVIAMGYKRYCKLFRVDKRSEFVNACKRSPLKNVRSPPRIQWLYLRALFAWPVNTINVGSIVFPRPRWPQMREKLPAVDADLVSLILEGGEILRATVARYTSDT